MLGIENVLTKLSLACIALGSQKNFAKKYGMSAAYVNDVLNYKREPGEKILRALNLKKVVGYVRISIFLSVLTLLLSVGVAQAEPIAQMPLSELKGLIVRVDTLKQREKLQAELIGHLREKDKVQTDYITKIEQANETIQVYATKLEQVNAQLEQQLADRPIDWVLVAEVAATTLTARWGGGHVWRWGKALMGR